MSDHCADLLTLKSIYPFFEHMNYYRKRRLLCFKVFFFFLSRGRRGEQINFHFFSPVGGILKFKQSHPVKLRKTSA